MYIYIFIITLSLDLFITLQYLFIITLSDFIHVLINFFIDLSNVQALDLSESRAANDIVLSTGGDAGATFSSQEVSSLHALSRSGGMDWDGDLMWFTTFVCLNLTRNHIEKMLGGWENNEMRVIGMCMTPIIEP